MIKYSICILERLSWKTHLTPVSVIWSTAVLFTSGIHVITWCLLNFFISIKRWKSLKSERWPKGFNLKFTVSVVKMNHLWLCNTYLFSKYLVMFFKGYWLLISYPYTINPTPTHIQAILIKFSGIRKWQNLQRGLFHKELLQSELDEGIKETN